MIMRCALKSLEGVRTTFRGTVAQFGMKSGYTGRDLPTLMLKAECLFNQGEGKVAYMMHDSVYDEMEPDDLPVINRFLKALGSTQQLEDE
jgi:hypothetical protein